MTKEFTDQLVELCAAPREPVTAAAAEPRAAEAAVPVTVPSRPTGLFARLHAWWAGLRSKRRGQSPQTARRSADTSGEAFGQGGRR